MPSNRPKVQYRLDQNDKDFIEFYARLKGFESAGAFAKVQAAAYMRKYKLSDNEMDDFKAHRAILEKTRET